MLKKIAFIALTSLALTANAAEPVKSSWDLVQHKDEMSGNFVNLARVRSTNTISLGWPYQGAQKGSLTVRKHPRWGTNVYFEVERGQLLCRYDRCSITVKFDDAAPKKVSAVEPEDNNSTLLFIQNETNFINQLRKSKRVVIEFGMFQQGSQTLVFDTNGFPSEVFPAAKAKKK